MVNKSDVLIILNLFGAMLVIICLYLGKGSTELITLSIMIALIIGLIDYRKLRGGANNLVRSLQYKMQKTLTCPKC